nr:hypothetical protein [uncultured Campylobacter sp.]
MLIACYLLPILFQFPTGWNSTVVAQNSTLIDLSFNSQRDEILPKLFQLVVKVLTRFQFPTG